MVTLDNTSREELVALCNMSILNANFQKDRIKTRMATAKGVYHGNALLADQDEIIQLAGKVLMDLSQEHIGC